MDEQDKTPAIAFEKDLDRELRELRSMLIEKNQAYGNSALDPVRLFSKADAVEQLRVRIDDKLSRLQRGQAAGEDTVLDLLGYLVLLRIAERRRAVRISREDQRNSAVIQSFWIGRHPSGDA